jgi:hypothetical protein
MTVAWSSRIWTLPPAHCEGCAPVDWLTGAPGVPEASNPRTEEVARILTKAVAACQGQRVLKRVPQRAIALQRTLGAMTLWAHESVTFFHALSAPVYWPYRIPSPTY